MPTFLKVLLAGIGIGGVALGGWKAFQWWQDRDALTPPTPDANGGGDANGGDANGGDANGGGGGGGGGGGNGATASGDPPNISGNAAGYNAFLYPSPAAVNGVLLGMLYSIPNPAAATPAAAASKFQADYNAVSDAFASGKLAPPPANFRGRLSVDGIMGKMSLRALEIAVGTTTAGPHKMPWPALVAKAKA